MQIEKNQQGGNFNVSKPIEYRPVFRNPLDVSEIKLYEPLKPKKPEIDKDLLVKEGKGHTGAVNSYIKMLNEIENQIYSLDDLEIIAGKGQQLIQKYKRLASPDFKNALEQQKEISEKAFEEAGKKDAKQEEFIDNEGNIYYLLDGKIKKENLEDYLLKKVDIGNKHLSNITLTNDETLLANTEPLTTAEFYNYFDKNVSSDLFTGNNEVLNANAKMNEVAGTKYVKERVKEALENVGSTERFSGGTNFNSNAKDSEGRDLTFNIDYKSKNKNNINQLESATQSFIKTMGTDVFNYYKKRAIPDYSFFVEKPKVDDKTLQSEIDKIYKTDDSYNEKYNKALELISNKQQKNPKLKVSLEDVIVDGKRVTKDKAQVQLELKNAALNLARKEFDKNITISEGSESSTKFDEGLSKSMNYGLGNDKDAKIGQGEYQLRGYAGVKPNQQFIVFTDKTKNSAKTIDLPAYRYNAWKARANDLLVAQTNKDNPKKSVILATEVFTKEIPQIQTVNGMEKITNFENYKFYISPDKSESVATYLPYDQDGKLLLKSMNENIKPQLDEKGKIIPDETLNKSLIKNIKQNLLNELVNKFNKDFYLFDNSVVKDMSEYSEIIKMPEIGELPGLSKVVKEIVNIPGIGELPGLSKLTKEIVLEKYLINNPEEITKNFTPENKQILQSIINDYKNADKIQVKWQPTITINAVAARPSVITWDEQDASFAPYYQDVSGMTGYNNSFVADVNKEVSKGQWISGKSYEVTLFVPTSLADERFYDEQDVLQNKANAQVQNISKDKPNQEVPFKQIFKPEQK